MGKTTAYSGDDLTECFPHHPPYKEVPYEPYCTGNVHHDCTASWLRGERGPIGPAGPTGAQGPVGASADGDARTSRPARPPRTGRRRNVWTPGPPDPQGLRVLQERLGTPGQPSTYGQLDATTTPTTPSATTTVMTIQRNELTISGSTPSAILPPSTTSSGIATYIRASSSPLPPPRWK